MKKNGFSLNKMIIGLIIVGVVAFMVVLFRQFEITKKRNFKNQILVYVEKLKQQVYLISMGDDADMDITLPLKGETISIDITKIPTNTSISYTGNIELTLLESGEYSYVLANIIGNGYKVNGRVNVSEFDIDNVIKYKKK